METKIDLEAIKADTAIVSKSAFNYVVDEVQKLVGETVVLPKTWTHKAG